MSENYYLECPELRGKTIKMLRVYHDDVDGTELQIDLTDGTCFTGSFCVTPVFEAKLICAGVSGVETLRTYELK